MNKKIILVISIACGLLALLLTRLYISAVEKTVAEKKAAIDRRYGTIDVLAFAHDTPAGTVLERSDFGYCTVPKLGLRGQALTKDRIDEVIGRKTLVSHSKMDILFWSDIEGGDPSLKGLSHDIKRQMRAISINVGPAQSVSGMVRPNDHVDVIGTFAFSNDPKDVTTLTILQNVLVLSTGRETAKTQDASGMRRDQYSLVTLEVSPREAEMIAFTEQMKGRLVLTLRNKNDTSFERELPQVDFQKIRSTIEELNLKRQHKTGGVFK
ncbi:MAG: Flp pilus assembly protein CpaB [Kiritimatiellae bacterium]|nr:Flp pilus assembly protein CpaB [Kiritimatiellia bacterium]